MYVRIFHYCIFFCLIRYATSGLSDSKKTFEYGVHMDGEKLAFALQDKVPAFNPVYVVRNINPQNPKTENRFTYLRVDYVNTLSKVTLEYDPTNATLTFFVKFPFMQTAFGVMGYAMPLLHRDLELD